MKHIVKVTLSAASFVLMGMSGQSANAQSGPEVTEGLLKVGKEAYMLECASCHGVNGDGEGPGAYILNPKPRNFELGVYKLRSTPNGEVPTPGDLFKTITDGIPGSMMPSFKSLSAERRWALSHYILRLGQIEEEESTPISVPAEPQITAARLANGAVLYDKLKCATCHGADGWGDGPASLGLKNDAKERVYPPNFTLGVFKGGSKASDLYTRIATGLDGSPMPSYAAEAKPAEIWDMVHYIQTLAKK